MPVRWAVLPPGAQPEAARANLRWAGFGDRTVVWSAGEPAAAGAERWGTARAEPALVTQVGRAFRDAFPDVPVLLDHGRHLVVDDGGALRGRVDTCWRIVPLPANTVVVGVAAATAVRVDPLAAQVVASLSLQRYADDIGWLAALHTRHSLSAGFARAADRVEAALDGLGLATRREPVDVGGGRSENVVGDLAGTGGGLVVVTAHLDSVNLAGGPPRSTGHRRPSCWKAPRSPGR
jgi:hypothetical protein